jgi:hypothetical protein
MSDGDGNWLHWGRRKNSPPYIIRRRALASFSKRGGFWERRRMGRDVSPDFVYKPDSTQRDDIRQPNYTRKLLLVMSDSRHSGRIFFQKLRLRVKRAKGFAYQTNTRDSIPSYKPCTFGLLTPVWHNACTSFIAFKFIAKAYKRRSKL